LLLLNLLVIMYYFLPMLSYHTYVLAIPNAM